MQFPKILVGPYLLWGLSITGLLVVFADNLAYALAIALASWSAGVFSSDWLRLQQ